MLLNCFLPIFQSSHCPHLDLLSIWIRAMNRRVRPQLTIRKNARYLLPFPTTNNCKEATKSLWYDFRDAVLRVFSWISLHNSFDHTEHIFQGIQHSHGRQTPVLASLQWIHETSFSAQERLPWFHVSQLTRQVAVQDERPATRYSAARSWAISWKRLLYYICLDSRWSLCL